ncbi:MAG: hypothetical protein HKP27_02190 [Myxococcales bacterium]|nr:hypothetical protein [Myxococcales bacterium]
MDFMKMLADWRRVLARSVLAFHVACAAVGLLVLLGVISIPFMTDTAPGGAALATAAFTGLLCLLASCAFGGGVRYAVYGDFRLLPSRRFRDYFSGDDDGAESSAYVPVSLPERTQRASDDEMIDQAAEAMLTEPRQFMDLFDRLQGRQCTPAGEIPEELAPRIRELGLEHKCKELWEQGWTVLEDVASPEFLDELRTATQEAGEPGALHLLPKHPAFARAALNEKLMAIAEYSVGAGFLLSHMATSYKRKGDPDLGVHCDETWMPTPLPEHNLMLTACWALDDYTAESGATCIVPGSAALRRYPTAEEITSSRSRLEPILCKAGSVALWDGRVWHGNNDRTIDGARRVLHVTYNRLYVRQMETYPRSVEDQMIEKYGEPMAQLMGRYDYLAKPAGKEDFAGFMRAVAYSRR